MKRCYKVFIDGSISSYILSSESRTTVDVRTDKNPLITKFSKHSVFFTFEEAKLESLRILNKQLQHLKNEIEKYENGVNYLKQLNEDNLEHYDFTVFSVDI